MAPLAQIVCFIKPECFLEDSDWHMIIGGWNDDSMDGLTSVELFNWKTGEQCEMPSGKPKTGNTIYKWEGSDHRWSRENLACLSKQKNIFLLFKTTQIFDGTNGNDLSRYGTVLTA